MKQAYSLRLEEDTINEIKRLAEERKVKHTVLVRKLLRASLKKMRQEAKASPN